MLLGSVHTQLSGRVDLLALLDRLDHLWLLGVWLTRLCTHRGGSGCLLGVLGGFMGLRRGLGGLGACCSGSEELLRLACALEVRVVGRFRGARRCIVALALASFVAIDRYRCACCRSWRIHKPRFAMTRVISTVRLLSRLTGGDGSCSVTVVG